jgi:TonB family protein
MMTRRLLILFITASLAGHALVLALATRINWSAGSRPEKLMTVELKAPGEPALREENQPAETAPQKAEPDGIAFREDSVALQSHGSRYDTYLQTIRKKIEQLWDYPTQALAEKREGNAVIRFTINADGTLTGYHVMTTSGSPVLDEGALAVVQSAAPYDPFPGSFKLSRLNITATFSYRMNP